MYLHFQVPCYNVIALYVNVNIMESSDSGKSTVKTCFKTTPKLRPLQY